MHYFWSKFEFSDFGQNPDFSHDFAWRKKPSENSHRSNHFASHYIIIRLKPTVAPNSAPCLTHSLQFFTIKKENITEIKRKIGKIWRKRLEKNKRQNYALKLQVNNFVDFLSKISTSLRPLIGKRWSMNHQVLDFFEQKCVWKVRKISQKREKWAFLASIWSTGRCKSWTRWEFRSGFVTRKVIRNFSVFFENFQKFFEKFQANFSKNSMTQSAWNFVGKNAVFGVQWLIR